MQVSTPVNASKNAVSSAKVKATLQTKLNTPIKTSQLKSNQDNSLTRLLASCCDCV